MSENKKQLTSNKDQMINLGSIFMDIAREWLMILLLTASAAIVAHVGMGRLRPPMYASTASIAVNNNNPAADLNNSAGADSYNSMSRESKSALLLVDTLQSGEMKAAVAQEMGTPFSGSISAQVIKDGNMVRFTVKSRSVRTSYLEAKAVLRCCDKLSDALFGGTEITVLRQPRAQASPVNAGSNRKYVIAFAGLVFLGLCGLIALRSCLRETVRSIAEVDQKVDAKLLGAVARKDKLLGSKGGTLITDPAVNPQFAQDLRRLAARICNEMTQKDQKILLVAGAGKDEGRSTVSAGLAMAMAEFGKKTVLIDTDFRHPSLYKILSLQDSKFMDLGNWLEKGSKAGDAELANMAQAMFCPVPDSELVAILNRKAVPQAMEKYSELIRMLLGRLQEEADFIILDSACIDSYSDAEELANMADTSVIVVRQHHNEMRNIDEAVTALGGSERMIGCIFNDAGKNGIGANTAGKAYGY